MSRNLHRYFNEPENSSPSTSLSNFPSNHNKKKEKKDAKDAKFQTIPVLWTPRESQKLTLFFFTVYIEI